MVVFDPKAITDVLVSHAMGSGLFETVNGAEPTNAPPEVGGLIAGVWADSCRPLGAASGLRSTSGLITWVVQLYANMFQDPRDGIDPRMASAAHYLVSAYSGDFEMGGQVRNIDLLGQYSDGLSWRTGYLEIDKRMFRVLTITVPVVINDLWDQSP